MKHAILFAAILLMGCYKEPTFDCQGQGASATFYSFLPDDVVLVVDGFPLDTLQPGEAHKYEVQEGTYEYCTGSGEAVGSFTIDFPCRQIAIRLE